MTEYFSISRTWMIFFGWCIFILCPILLFVLEICLNHRNLSFHVIAMVLSNLMGLLPASQCLYYTLTSQKLMILESMVFYAIVYCSSSYHLCAQLFFKGQFCTVMSPISYHLLDFIISYFCIVTTVIFLTKLEIVFEKPMIPRVLKSLFFLCEFSCITASTVLMPPNDTLPLYITFASFIPMILLAIIYYKEYLVLYWTKPRLILFAIGIFLVLIAFCVYVYSVLIYHALIPRYWLYHSFGWHIPILTCPVFFIEATIICPRPFFTFIYENILLFARYFTYSFQKVQTMEVDELESGKLAYTEIMSNEEL